MKRIAFAALLMAVAPTLASAADLPGHAPVRFDAPPLSGVDWAGLYAGAQVGYEFGRSNALATAAATGSGLAANGVTPGGPIGGVHIGYNYVIPGVALLGGDGRRSLLLGAEGDFEGAAYPGYYNLGQIGDRTNQRFQGSVRGRLGAATGRILLYATGGVAFSRMSNVYTNLLNGSADVIRFTRTGYTVGGGAEYAIDANWSARIEYRYANYGTFSRNLANSTMGGVNVAHSENEHRVQAGLSYRIDLQRGTAPLPVVARY